MRLDLLAALNAERAARRPVVLVTELASGAERLVTADQVAGDPRAAALAAALASGKSGMVGEGEARAFLTVHLPPPRLLVAGAVHISQALAPMARMVGFDVTLMDPRTAFATQDRFPGVPILADWPDVVLPAFRLDPFTGLVALTHDPKLDDPAIAGALEAGCFYIGALGSRRTHAKRVERLAAQGFSDRQIASIAAPIGLDIGASSPEEIAVAILAQVIAAWRRPDRDGAAA